MIHKGLFLNIKENLDLLDGEGFRKQKLFADDILYYIRDIPSMEIDDSLFVRGYDGWLRRFLMLDFSGLTMIRHVVDELGRDYPEGTEWVASIDIDKLREEIDPCVALIEAIQAGGFDGDISHAIGVNSYNNQEYVDLGYDVLLKKMVALPVWRGRWDDFNNPERPKKKWEVQKCSTLYKYQFDWLYKKVKSGDLVVGEFAKK